MSNAAATTETAAPAISKADIKNLIATYSEIDSEIDSAEATIAAHKVRRSSIAEAIGKAISPNVKLRHNGEVLTYTHRKAKGSDVVTHYLKSESKRDSEPVEVE